MTGAMGFLGTVLTRQLLKIDELHKLILIDSESPADQPALSDPRVIPFKGDLADRSMLQALLKAHQIQGVFHLARSREVGAQDLQWIETLLELTGDQNIPLVTCSRADVYGPTPSHRRFDESARIKPSSPAAAIQASADLILQAAARAHKQDLVIARATEIYGPGQRQEEFIPNLIYHALRKKPLPLDKAGSRIRDWLHVEDCCVGLIAAFQKGQAGRVYHLSAAREHTDLGIARKILKQLGHAQNLIVQKDDLIPPDVRNALDPTLALHELDWKARIPFREGFPETVRALAARLRKA